MSQYNTVEGSIEPNTASLDAFLNGTDVFDEVLPEPIRVSLIDFKNKDTGEKDEDGNPILVREPRARIAYINTYVPMKVLHRMMSSQEKLRRMQGLAKAGASEEGNQVMLTWMTEQVLEVWRLTEPNMTAEKLSEGLSYQKIFGLFGRFFGDLLKQLNAKQ